MEVLNDLNISNEHFWSGFSDIIDIYYKKNNDLLNHRKNLQSKINDWYVAHRSKDINLEEYKKFLKEIKYIVNEGPEFKITTSNVDKEISTICGPQLVVPITNARFALNAVNARWGSFYDALYGTDTLGDMPEGSSYDSERGTRVVAFAKSHLDKFAPLLNTSWVEINNVQLIENKIILSSSNNSNVDFENNDQIIGWRINKESTLSELILKKNNLHCRILLNANDTIGRNDPANIADVLIESAISTILDCEDSVATVDADDKILAYRNWLGLVKGDL
jgi:malate synthase